MDFDWTDPEVSATIPSDCSDLNLFNARIGDDGAQALALALLNTDAEVESLNLRDNRIGDVGAAALAGALARNKHVQFLQLRGNDLGDRGAAAIAECLHTNTVLMDVYMTWLDVGDHGAVAIADALKNNPDSAVRVLHLSWNRIGPDGAAALAAALDSTTLKLRELNLQNNRAVDNAAAVSFMRAIEHNQHLTKLWLSGTQVDDAYSSHLNALLARGPESRKRLAEVAVMLEDCGLLGTLDVVHEELGVEELEDLAHVSRADLKDTRGLKPVKRNKLIKCTCALLVDGSPLDMEDPTMCPGRSPGDGASL